MDIIKNTAEKYHDRMVLSLTHIHGQLCDVCNSKCGYTVCIEHDSMDFSKDKRVCAKCYEQIKKYWLNNKPGKISPI